MKRKPSFPPQKMATPTGGECWQCTARRRKTARRCRKPAVKGSSSMKCAGHGGRAADTHAGPANANWQGGTSKPRYSGPAVFNERVLAAHHDPDLLDQSAEIAVVTAFAIEQVKLLEPGVDPAAFAAEVDRLVTGMRTSSSDEIRAAVNNLVLLSSTASGQLVIQNRILRLFEKRRKLIESQRRRAAELALAMPRAEVLRVSIGLLEAVTRHVRDAVTLAAIRDEIRGVIGDRIADDGTVH